MFVIILMLAVASVIEAKSIEPKPLTGPATSYPHQLLLLNGEGGKLWRVSIDAEFKSALEEQLLISPSNASSSSVIGDFDVDPVENRLLFIDEHSRINFTQLMATQGENATGSLNLTASIMSSFQYHPTGSGARIAYDPLAGNVYAVDGQSQEVDVIDLKHHGQQRRCTELFKRADPVKQERAVREKPRRVALDSSTGLMFILTDISGSTKHIYRSNMDGTSKRLLISNVGTRDELMDVDRRNKRIYWIDTEDGSIKSADYEGANNVSVVKVENPLALAVHDTKLFWSTNPDGADDMTVINVCKLDNDANVCESSSIRRVQLKRRYVKPHSLKAVRPSPTTAVYPAEDNPCDNDNGGCQHLCLLTSTDGSRSRSCACDINWEATSDDPHKCQLSTGKNDEKESEESDESEENRPRRQVENFDMYSQQPTLRPHPQQPEQPAHIPIYIYYPGK